MKNILKLTAVILLLSACNTQNKQITDKTGQTFTSAKIYEQVKGVTDTSLNYALYFPKNFDSKTPLSVIFFLDPHAQGDIPLKKYSALADKYNYLLVGSNVSRNGMSVEAFNNHFKSLISDVTERYPINAKHMFTAGFSGGAKMAMICAETYPEIIGVAACGGVVANTFTQQPHYYFAGIIGNQDFNYLEVRQYFNLFDSYGFDYTASVFDGGHQWADADAFEMAFVGFEIYLAKKENNKMPTEWLDNLSKRINDSVELYKKQNRSIDQYEILQQQNRWFYGLESVKEVQQQIAKIVRTQAFIKEVSSRRQAFKHEVKLRAEFVRAMEQKDLAWWQSELQKINKVTNNKEIDLVKKRLLNYVSMVSYMLIKTNLENADLQKAEKKLQVYQLIDPINADVDLMYAQYYLQKGNTEKMKEYFASAKQKDPNIEQKNCNDPFWKKLFSFNKK